MVVEDFLVEVIFWGKMKSFWDFVGRREHFERKKRGSQGVGMMMLNLKRVYWDGNNVEQN